MTEEQAIKIAKIIKAGKIVKSGHYHYGYIYLSYNNDKQLFEIKREDLSAKEYESSFYYEYITQNKFIAFIMKYYTFENMMKNFQS